MLPQPITKEFIFRQLNALSTDSLVEVAQFIEYLQFRGPLIHSADTGKHTAFGIWANRSEVEDSAAFSLQLRQNLEQRKDD